MRLEFTRSATRHGVSRARIAHVIEHCGRPLYDPAWFDVPDGVLFLGWDANGVPLEVIAMERPNDVLVVIHAMPLLRKYLSTLEEVMRWHEP